jgi:flagellar basal-body rod protein FlgG
MIRGFYTALSGIRSGLTRQAAVAEDLANVQTVGFKRSATDSEDFQLELALSLGGTIGRLGTGVQPGVAVEIDQGSFQETGMQSDLAIEGDGLFAVRTANGTAYTRAGNFTIDARGMLVTSHGDPVLDTQGRTITTNGSLTVAPDGTVVGTTQRIALYAWPTSGLSRAGDTSFTSARPLGPATGQIRQGELERSNVDLGSSMTELMALQREFALNARALSLQEGTLAEATQLGRLR